MVCRVYNGVDTVTDFNNILNSFGFLYSETNPKPNGSRATLPLNLLPSGTRYDCPLGQSFSVSSFCSTPSRATGKQQVRMDTHLLNLSYPYRQRIIRQGHTCYIALWLYGEQLDKLSYIRPIVQSCFRHDICDIYIILR